MASELVALSTVESNVEYLGCPNRNCNARERHYGLPFAIRLLVDPRKTAVEVFAEPR